MHQHRQNVDDAEQLGLLLMLAKHASPYVKQTINGGRTFFLTVSRMNGSLGFGESPQGSIQKTLKVPYLG